MKQPESLPNSLQKMMQSVVGKYGERNDMLVRYSPSAQIELSSNSDECFFGNYPTLAEMRAYGANTPIAWLIPQLNNLSEYCGCKVKLQGEVLEETAHIIAQEYYHLKVSELMLFFYRFKAGRYGRFYGSVDPLVITTALRDFADERLAELRRHENAERMAKMEEERKGCITYEEYIRTYKKNQLI